MDDVKTISVLGLGKLGAPMVASFAHQGFRVIGVDVDAHKIEAVGSGRAPVFEPRLDEMLAANKERITATTDLEGAVRESEATFIVVATPSEAAGNFSLRFVLPA